MKNKYAKEYYNDFLKKLPTDYKSARWFSSEEAKLDYEQTLRSLRSVLKDGIFESVLEIGPGDGVWTELLIPKSNKLTLLDQSIEMINRAKDRLASHGEKLTYVVEDFLEFSSEETYDLIFAIRCFEYFEDKERAAQQFHKLLKPGGMLILVTKNPEHATMQKVQNRELHKGQISKNEIIALFTGHQLDTKAVLSATWRFKAKYFLMRKVFDVLHNLHVLSKGRFCLPIVTSRLTESYLYVAKKR